MKPPHHTAAPLSVAGQQMKGLSSTLGANKSWFFTEDAVICLTAGIGSTDGVAAETIVDNRNLGTRGTHTLTVDGRVQPATQGWGGSKDPVTPRCPTLWLDHGTAPSDAACAYLLMPGAGAAATAARAPRTEVGRAPWPPPMSCKGFRRRSWAHGRNFWHAATLEHLATDAPAGILVHEKRGRATLARGMARRTAEVWPRSPCRSHRRGSRRSVTGRSGPGGMRRGQCTGAMRQFKGPQGGTMPSGAGRVCCEDAVGVSCFSSLAAVPDVNGVVRPPLERPLWRSSRWEPSGGGQLALSTGHRAPRNSRTPVADPRLEFRAGNCRDAQPNGQYEQQTTVIESRLRSVQTGITHIRFDVLLLIPSGGPVKRHRR
ncbi:hypothetical protein GCM10009647_082430 [Streptomyces sanglieri]|uniref:Polysaccharide lyase family 8 super-sandwich domain-containing protein n=1 Tax=Streptomyces sanglieri TaxID=193460 RepID=A0ABW2WRP4_9ACTN